MTMLDAQQIETVRQTIRWVLAQCDVPYKVTLLDQKLYQNCVDEAVRRGYPVGDGPSVLTYLRDGVCYATTACEHHSTPIKIWVALYSSIFFYIDDAPSHSIAQISSIAQFNARFVRNEPQGCAMMNALANILNRVPDLFRPGIPTDLITTGSLNYITANLLELETTTMQISTAARGYPTYQRALTCNSEAYAYIVFPPEIPLVDYVQAIPDLMQFIYYTNDVLSFYKEELAGETVNDQISNQAARNQETRLETFVRVAKEQASLHEGIVKTLEGSPAACDTFKRFTAGVIGFHASSPRYKLDEVYL